jgi:UDP-N-acetylglucosamine 2-epimerase (non-hydrolysing)
MNKENKKTKVMTIFGTRPEIIRLSRVFSKLDEYTNHIMVHTGQSYDYEMNEIFFEDLEIRKPDYFLEIKADTLGEQIANIIKKSEEVLKKEKPDALLILGDTNSALSAIVAKRMGIPIFHMEAGNRCFDRKVPEEINRRIVDHISDINLPYSENARLNLLQEGIHQGSIYVTGSPMAEIIEHYKEKIMKSDILEKLEVTPKEYFVASIHREENVEDEEALNNLIESLNEVAEKYKKPILVSTHPRTRNKLEKINTKVNKLVDFHKPFGYFDYMKLQKEALCVLSDSGTILEESSILKFPAIQVRMSSERPEAFDKGVAILSGLDKEKIIESIEITVSEYKKGYLPNIPENYKDLDVSNKVLRLIIGLSEIISKRRSW